MTTTPPPEDTTEPREVTERAALTEAERRYPKGEPHGAQTAFIAGALWHRARGRDFDRPSPGVVDLRPGGDDARVVAAEAEAARWRQEAESLREAYNHRTIECNRWQTEQGRLIADRDEARAALAALREGIEALATGITPEMQALADKGRFRALWFNLRSDLRALADTAGAPRTAESGEQTGEADRAYAEGRWCGECQYGQVEDPPCCTPAPVVPVRPAGGAS